MIDDETLDILGFMTFVVGAIAFGAMGALLAIGFGIHLSQTYGDGAALLFGMAVGIFLMISGEALCRFSNFGSGGVIR